MAPRVFVSYARTGDRRRDEALALATFLRAQGVDATLDVWAGGTRRDWYRWALGELTAADHVVVVASEAYRRASDSAPGGPSDSAPGGPPGGRDDGSEAVLLRELVHADRDTWLPKILPVLLPGHGPRELPLFLQPNTADHYRVTELTVDGAEGLLRVILGRDAHPAPPLGTPPDLPPAPDEPDVSDEPDGAVPGRDTGHGATTNQVNGPVGGPVVQAGTIHGGVRF